MKEPTSPNKLTLIVKPRRPPRLQNKGFQASDSKKNGQNGMSCHIVIDEDEDWALDNLIEFGDLLNEKGEP